MTQPLFSGIPADRLALLSRRGGGLPNPLFPDPRGSAQIISFLAGFPDLGSLPVREVVQATASALSNDGYWALQYGHTTGYPRLVDALLAKLRRDQGIEATRENVLITAGSSQALTLVLDLFADWGDTVITEQPTWLGAVQALKNVGANAVSVAVDERGVSTSDLEHQLVRLKDQGVQPKLIYVIPNFQNPTGVTTTLERRRRVVELAHEYGMLIIEDDAYFDIRYGGKTLPPICVLDDLGTTMYLGTFSKIMGAGMRLGWVVASPEIISRLAALKIEAGPSIFSSHVAAEWMLGHLDTHILMLRRIYRDRRNVMLAALERYMPPGTVWTRPDGGFFIWLTFPEGVDTNRILSRARDLGVEFLPGKACYMGRRGSNQMRLSFSFAPDKQIEPGIRIIAGVAKDEIKAAAIPPDRNIK